MFSLTEVTLKEMGMARIGDRLFTVDCLQSLYEELTSWKKRRETVQATVDPARLLGGGASAAPQGGVTSAGRGYATASPSGAGAGSAGTGGGRGSAGAGASSVLQQLLAQGFSLPGGVCPRKVAARSGCEARSLAVARPTCACNRLPPTRPLSSCAGVRSGFCLSMSRRAETVTESLTHCHVAPHICPA